MDSQPRWRKIVSVGLFSLLSHLNVADRFCIAGILPEIQPYFSINDGASGLLQTVFVLAYVLFSLVASFVGDRFNRKYILLIANFVWILLMLASSFIPGEMFWLFLILRSLSACGNAISFGVAVPMIGDLFQNDASSRGYALMTFYWSLPVGSSLGILCSSVLAQYTEWQWILRLWPVLAAIILILIFIFVEDSRTVEASRLSMGDIWEDMKIIFRVKSFVLVIFGQALSDMCIVSQVWWKTLLVREAIDFQENTTALSVFEGQSFDTIQTSLGVIVALSGLFGGLAAMWICQSWKEGRFCFSCIKTSLAFPLVATIGSLIALPTMVLMPYSLTINIWLVYFLNGFNQFMPGGNNVIAAEIVMEAIPSTRRATATSVLYVIAYLIGDCPGPYIVGAISDAIRSGSEDPQTRFYSLTYALFVTSSLYLPTAIVFAFSAYFLRRERITTSGSNRFVLYEEKLRVGSSSSDGKSE
ncbi:hypothetical protein PFISCL1PPCAC_27171 [Pristionchus fissidentatus]|uniref:Major facilitator superfamily (MFS) profile domain-containing protein n=1 Tax=Pristionchus fissidentatus TaxID=1538716 RepID=A0AAV5X247_9BILA|nr:hypothetical protein PFISCL1PPCAC_27171 [Pristionchus fissidentatus]